MVAKHNKKNWREKDNRLNGVKAIYNNKILQREIIVDIIFISSIYF